MKLNLFVPKLRRRALFLLSLTAGFVTLTGPVGQQCCVAASPQLNRILPRGGQIGQVVEVTFHGNRLKDAEDVLFYDPGVKLQEIVSAEDKKVTAKIQLAKSCDPGELKMRLRCRSGLSELQTFWAGPFPVLQEKEQNGNFERPQQIAMNQTVEGVIQREDVDYFVVEAKKGQRLVAEIEAMRLGGPLFDPYIAILDRQRFELAASDDSALLLQDSVAGIVVPADGKYVIQVRDSAYGGSGEHRYRLHVGAYCRPLTVYPPGGPVGQVLKLKCLGDPAGSYSYRLTLPADPQADFAVFPRKDAPGPPSANRIRVSPFENVLEAEPNHNRQKATQLQKMPIALNGIISQAGDQDWFKIPGYKDWQVEIRVYARSVRSPLDAVLSLHDKNGKQIASNDDAGAGKGGADPFIEHKFADAGPYYLRVRDHLGRGSETSVYRVEITHREASLKLGIPVFGKNSQARQTVPVPQGNRYALVVQAQRQFFGGDLQLAAQGLPGGVKMTTVPLPGSTDRCVALFEATQDARLNGKLVDLTAHPTDPKLKFPGHYVHQISLVVAQPNNTVYYQTSVEKLPVAVTEPVPFRIDLEKPPVPIVRNGSMDLKVKLQRREGFDKDVTVRLLWKPPGIGGKGTIKIPAGKTEAVYPINANGRAQLKEWHIAVLAEADAGYGQSLVSSELVPLTVTEPYVEMKLKMAVIEQGREGQMVCTVNPRKPFQGPATVKLVNLPAKVSSDQLELSPDAKELVFPVRTAGDSPPGKHKNVFCQVLVKENGHTIPHNVAYGGTLRIDKPRPAATVAKKKPEQKKPQKPAAAAPKQLSRLEQLRQQARQKGK